VLYLKTVNYIIYRMRLKHQACKNRFIVSKILKYSCNSQTDSEIVFKLTLTWKMVASYWYINVRCV